ILADYFGQLAKLANGQKISLGHGQMPSLDIICLSTFLSSGRIWLVLLVVDFCFGGVARLLLVIVWSSF
ncbi:10014_t:CDS:2, partial [Funneliformis geosporum]